MRSLKDHVERIPGPITWLARGRQLFTRNLKAAIAIPLAALGPLVVFLALAIVGPTTVLSVADKTLGRQGELLTASIVEGYLGTISIAFMLLMPGLLAGVAACFLEGIRTGNLTAGRLWDGFRNWWACTWVVWLLGCGTALSIPLVAILVGVPSIYGLHTLMWLALFRIVDGRRAGVEALGFAWRVMQRRWLILTVFTFLMMTLVMAGTLVVVGIVTIVPIAAGALAAAYEDLRTREAEEAEAK